MTEGSARLCFLATQPNFHAKVKLVTGEHAIKTKPAPLLLSESQIQERINAIKRQMLRRGYCRDYREVEREIRERQARLRTAGGKDQPPPSHTNGSSQGADNPPPPHD